VASNSFGTLFRITTWGESHGAAIGVVIDGCPAGLALSAADIQKKLDLRRPGNHAHTSERAEKDDVHLLSGVFEGTTTGAPISLLIRNHDTDKGSYEATRELFPPSSPKLTWLEKYGVFDYFGSGRASARETASRVAAGAIASKIIEEAGIKIVAYLHGVGHFGTASMPTENTVLTPSFCLNNDDEAAIGKILDEIEREQDSIGGAVGIWAFGVPPGLGDPVYEKIQSKLASGMMSIPGARAFEWGDGVAVSFMKGSDHNDRLQYRDGKMTPLTNHSGGAFGGITNEKPLRMKVHFKPTASIGKPQEACTRAGHIVAYSPEAPRRHDRSIALRAPPVCEAMCALVLADSLLLSRSSKIAFPSSLESAMKE